MTTHYVVHLLYGGKMHITEYTHSEFQAMAREEQRQWAKRKGLFDEDKPDVPEEFQDEHPRNTPISVRETAPSHSLLKRLLFNTRRSSFLMKTNHEARKMRR